MSKIAEMMKTPELTVANWQEIEEEVIREFRVARTEAERVALLAAYIATMKLVEKSLDEGAWKVRAEEWNSSLNLYQIQHQEWEHIKGYHRDRVYHNLLQQEWSIDGVECLEMRDKIIKREVASGRMPKDHFFVKYAEARKTEEPTFFTFLRAPSREKLIKRLKKKTRPPPPPPSSLREFINNFSGLAVFVAVYLGIPWALSRWNDNDRITFWVALGVLLAGRMFYAIVEIAAEALRWRLTKKWRIAGVVAVLRDNKYPDPADVGTNAEGWNAYPVRHRGDWNYYEYMRQLADDETQTEKMRQLAQGEVNVYSGAQMHMGFLTERRYHATMNAALRAYCAELDLRSVPKS